MSAFLLPLSLGEERERMLNSFHWGSKKNGSRGINWLRWSKLTKRKNHGGLNFRNLEAFNLAMLGKQGWKLLNDPSSLLARVLKARYDPSKGFLDAGLGHNPSFTWRKSWQIAGLLVMVTILMFGGTLGYARLKILGSPLLCHNTYRCLLSMIE